jgi:chitinase
MLSSTVLSAVILAISLIPLLSHCSPLLDTNIDHKAGLEQKRDDNLVNQAQAATASSVNTSPTIATTTPTANVYSLPPNAFPTRPIFTQAPTGSQQPAPSQPQAVASVPVPAPAIPLVMAYYPDWASFPPEKIDFRRFDWIDFAFAVPDRNFNLGWDDPKAPDMLRRLVSIAHARGKKVKLSVGGWSGSK